MLTLLASVAIMLVVVGSLVTWAKHEQRRRAASDPASFEGIEEV
jgi:hypothetical protein